MSITTAEIATASASQSDPAQVVDPYYLLSANCALVVAAKRGQSVNGIPEMMRKYLI
jgi:hypothetical protein